MKEKYFIKEENKNGDNNNIEIIRLDYDNISNHINHGYDDMHGDKEIMEDIFPNNDPTKGITIKENYIIPYIIKSNHNKAENTSGITIKKENILAALINAEKG